MSQYVKVWTADGSCRTFAADLHADVAELSSMCARKLDLEGYAAPCGHRLYEYREVQHLGRAGSSALEVVLVRLPEKGFVAAVFAAWERLTAASASALCRFVYWDPAKQQLSRDDFKRPTRTFALPGEDYKSMPAVPPKSPAFGAIPAPAPKLRPTLQRTNSTAMREREVLEYVNELLAKRGVRVNDVREELRSGTTIAMFLEEWGGVPVPGVSMEPRGREQEIANLAAVLQHLRTLGCLFVGVIPEDLYYSEGGAAMLRFMAVLVQWLKRQTRTGTQLATATTAAEAPRQPNDAASAEATAAAAAAANAAVSEAFGDQTVVVKEAEPTSYDLNLIDGIIQSAKKDDLVEQIFSDIAQ